MDTENKNNVIELPVVTEQGQVVASIEYDDWYDTRPDDKPLDAKEILKELPKEKKRENLVKTETNVLIRNKETGETKKIKYGSIAVKEERIKRDITASMLTLEDNTLVIIGYDKNGEPTANNTHEVVYDEGTDSTQN